MTTIIYGLYCPIAQAIRYIGKSSQPKKRLLAHFYAADSSGPTYKQRWMASVLKKGLLPELKVLEAIPDGGDWAAAEIRWIAHAAEQGWPITNHDCGGKGGTPLNEESRKKRFESMGSAQTRARMSASAKARWADPEKRARGIEARRSEEARKQASESAHRRSTPEYREMMSAKSTAAWRDPIKKSRIISGITPEVRMKVSQAAKRMWKTNGKAAVMLANLRRRQR